MVVRRFDGSGSLSAKRDNAGLLRGTANLTRVGVLSYRQADGSVRRELRHPDEVFSATSLATLSLAPMTLGHPTQGPVTSKNARNVVVGTIGESVKADGKFVRAPFVVHDDAAIAEIEAGRKRELSCGYNCDLDFTPGVFEGESYDAVQRNIEYNHVAVLDKGRAGPEVRIDGDAWAAFEETNIAPNTRTDGATMKTIKIDGVDFDVSSPAFDQAFAKYQTQNDARVASLMKDATDAKAAADKATGRADALDAEIKTLKEASAPEAIEKRISARVALVAQATKVLGAAFKADGKSDDEIKRAVVLKASPSAKLDGQSADYVAARFDHVVESYKTDAATVSTAALRKDLGKLDELDHEDEDSLDDSKQFNEMVKRNRDAWKNADA